MKDKELIELTRRLFQKTLWNDTEKIIRKYSLKEDPIVIIRPPKGMDLAILSGNIEWEIPMYNVEYLLDKLEEKHYQLRLEHNHSDMKWYAYYAGKNLRQLFDKEFDWYLGANTPLEAVLTLAIIVVSEEKLK